MSTVKLRVTRPLWFDGNSHAEGAILATDESEAITLLESGRAALVDPADGPALKVFAYRQLKKIMHASGPPLGPAPGSPWISRGGRFH